MPSAAAPARLRELPVPFVDRRRSWRPYRRRSGPRTRLACFDHITRPARWLLPIRDMGAAVRERGVPVASTGRPCAGPARRSTCRPLGVDWYCATCTNGRSRRRQRGHLVAAPDVSGAAPTRDSHALVPGFPAEFDYTARRDNSAGSAATGGARLCRRLGAEAIAPITPRSRAKPGRCLIGRGTRSGRRPDFCAVDGLVRLPGTAGVTATRHTARLRLETSSTASLPDHGARRRLWVRISAQIYNEIGDYRRLAAIANARRGEAFGARSAFPEGAIRAADDHQDVTTHGEHALARLHCSRKSRHLAAEGLSPRRAFANCREAPVVADLV